MSYIRNPRDPNFWESDGEYTGKFKGDDGTLHDTAEEADRYDSILRKRHAKLFGDERGGLDEL